MNAPQLSIMALHHAESALCRDVDVFADWLGRCPTVPKVPSVDAHLPDLSIPELICCLLEWPSDMLGSVRDEIRGRYIAEHQDEVCRVASEFDLSAEQSRKDDL